MFVTRLVKSARAMALGAACLMVALPAHARLMQTRDPVELALAVEKRAAATDFAELEAFGEAALRTPGRESLNRLYHVTWTFLNQGDFDKAREWNGHLTQAATTQGDSRYIRIAYLNGLTIRYDSGDDAAVVEMARIAASDTDWFVRVHATRIHAFTLMNQNRIGESLKALNAADALIPDDDPYGNTARAGLWEMTGLGLMQLNDIEGATSAFSRFEIDYSNPAYPRPDFDAVYNLSNLSIKTGNMAQASRLYAIHHRLTERSALESLSVYDARLCAMVADGRDDPRGVVDCLAPYGEGFGAAEFMASQLLALRAIARARTGDIDGAQRDLANIRRREAAGQFHQKGLSEITHVEAELLHAQGRSADAFGLLRTYARQETVLASRVFSGGIGQVTGDMQAQLTERRRQLETARANTALQADMIQSQRWIVVLAAFCLLAAIGVVVWQRRMTRRLAAAQRRAEDANRSKSEFLANMSHEIRTPLNGVVAMADALSRRPLDRAEHDMVEIIRSSGTTLERLLSDILDSAKIEAGQVTIEPAPFHLGQAVQEVAALYRFRADEKGVDLVVTLDPAIDHIVMGDVVRVRQILSNLVSNALKFTGEGQVTIAAMTRVEALSDGTVRFSVADTGVGFDAAQRAHIFGRFHQADGSITRRFGGTGLGLAISRDLARLMGGELDCDSRPGVGSTFWFDLPLTPAAIQTVDQPRSDACAETAPEGLRILVADDHPANRSVIEVLLASTGATLVPVEDGREAVEAFRAGGFDLVLMDMQMPIMDGLAATSEIRRLEAAQGLPRTPILMLTANAMAEHVAAGHDAGADGHLAKPITMATLFAAIATASVSAQGVGAVEQVAA